MMGPVGGSWANSMAYSEETIVRTHLSEVTISQVGRKGAWWVGGGRVDGSEVLECEKPYFFLRMTEWHARVLAVLLRAIGIQGELSLVVRLEAALLIWLVPSRSVGLGGILIRVRACSLFHLL